MVQPGQALEGTSLSATRRGRRVRPDRAEAEQTLAEYLSGRARTTPESLHVIAEYLIGNLNDNGYLEGASRSRRMQFPPRMPGAC